MQKRLEDGGLLIVGSFEDEKTFAENVDPSIEVELKMKYRD